MGPLKAVPSITCGMACVLPRNGLHSRVPLGRNFFLSGSPIVACRSAKRVVNRNCVAFADGAVSTKVCVPAQNTSADLA